MNENGLSRFIVDYIESCKQSKLAVFDKKAEKKLAKLTTMEDITLVKEELAEQRKELEERYEVRNWLDDAANRAKKTSRATHAPKYSHSDAKGSSIFSVSSDVKENTEYLSTSALYKPAIDVVADAKYLDVAKLLQTEYRGDSLMECLNRRDYSALAELAENEKQLKRWVSGFRQVLSDETLSSHKLAKQLYFPINSDGDEYHLLSPLFSSSLASAVHHRIVDARFSELSKEINKSRKEESWHPGTRVVYPNTAVQNFGGTKPQNISYLNSGRGGSTWLLSCASPNWLSITKPPMERRSIFDRRSEFVSLARETIGKMRQYLFVVQDIENNRKIKKLRQEFVDQIIDILFNYVAGIQNLFELKGWSASDDCELKRTQQLWLDPYRCQLDKEFRFEREGGDWKKEIAADFSYWLNQSLKHERLEMELPERREWASEFKKRLREFEDELPEVMP
ncbi:type I-F CRISPR-associated protein Csy1 [Photorhabdus temperata]|uniref:CRISPR-associated protein, Csy1 family n=1 Tax=Photorhabdus khanii NC19 TaxID=1004151 RepID=W3V2S6_9GAMM|nr:type I-F CRISPR-associated protein Csy1 [Photorhabdus khanii]ETS30098.1 CRISPR-associated protein, Csy1 family [Photorhabdus khanii NC19]OHV55481.1 type I-F CRISPR-associated protein Csy1 [Photorhabdus temperata]